MQKIRKSILKRMKITKTGKVLHHGGGINHFQAKKSRSKQLANKRSEVLGKRQGAMVKSYLYH